LVLGAQAVQMGTAFLTCDEAGVVEAYKAALEAADDDHTAITRAFSGRAARGVVNEVMRTVPPEAILPFPMQNVLTRPMRSEAARQGRAEFLSLWAGQGLRLTRRGSAAELMTSLAAEATAALDAARG
jgi:nitronate monooxygenase